MVWVSWGWLWVTQPLTLSAPEQCPMEMTSLLTSFRVQRRRHGKHLLPDSEALLASPCLSPGTQQSSDHQNQGSWFRETPQCSAGECGKGQPLSRLDSPQAGGFSSLCLLQTGTLRVGVTDGPSWEAAPQRGSLKISHLWNFRRALKNRRTALSLQEDGF